jgi:FkbM family methyltransferase
MNPGMLGERLRSSSVPAGTALGWALRLPLRLIPPGIVVPILRGRLRGLKWIVGSCDHGCWLGSYEYEKRLRFEAALRRGTVLYDIGAHVGFYSLLGAVIVGDEGRVVAFEPLPRNRRYLQRHLELNGIRNVTIIEAAVASRSGRVRFAEGGSSTTGHLSVSGELEVDAVAIDVLVGDGTLPDPEYIKLDVEGAEYEALRGAEATIRRTRPVIFLATHGEEVHRRCCEFLASIGYHFESLDGSPVAFSCELLATWRG